MKIEGDKLIFSTGREFYAHRGIIGLGPDREASYGYDGGLPAWPSSRYEVCLTEPERQELADHMIAAWQAFKEADGPIPEEWD